MEPLSAREKKILSATVHHYVDTMEPVGSKILVQRFGFNSSSSTVRSAMGILEKKGFLQQPHASAGRVPSPQGYRHYVDCLLPPPGISIQHLQNELNYLSLPRDSFDHLLWQLARRLTDFTGLMSLITRPIDKNCRLKDVRLVQSGDRLLVMLVESPNQVSHLNLFSPAETAQHIQPIENWISEQLKISENGNLDLTTLPSHLHKTGSVLKDAIYNHQQAKSRIESDIVFYGISRLASQPEFTDIKNFQPILDLIDSDPKLVLTINSKHISGVSIGEENPQNELSDCSVVQASYRSSSDCIGYVALIGPMRMAYANTMAAVKNVAKYLERILS